MSLVVLVSGHYAKSYRKAGFHWICESLLEKGHEVLFFTTALSAFSYIKRDHRLRYDIAADFNVVRQISERLYSFVWYTGWHPVNLRNPLLNAAFSGLFRTYGSFSLHGAEDFFRKADAVILESGPGLVLFDRIRKLAPKARLIYRVSDDLRVIGCHPVVLEAERRIAADFDLISVPSPEMIPNYPPPARVRFDPQGLKRQLFDLDVASPYVGGRPGPNLVTVGEMLFDRELVLRAADLHPDVNFHIIGPSVRSNGRQNIHSYGEMRFADTVPFIKHADIGAAPYRYQRGSEYVAHSSNKLLQYKYCRLPVIGPRFIGRNGDHHIFTYDRDDPASVSAAIAAARRCNRSQINTRGIHSWMDLANGLVSSSSLALGAEPLPSVPA